MNNKKPAKKPLSSLRIADCALKIADSDGLNNLSMRKIASKLGVEPMSLYHHIPSKQRLMEIMVDRMVSELPQSVNSGFWKDVLSSVAWQWRGLALSHPGGFPLLATRAQVSQNLVQRFTACLQSLQRGGLDSSDAARCLMSFFFSINGFLLAAGKPFLFTEIPEPSFEELNHEVNGALEEISAEVWNFSNEKGFDAHVQLLLTGISAQIENIRAAS